MRLAVAPVFLLMLLTTIPAFPQVQVGDPAPDFSLARFGGGTVSLDDYPGKILFLNFFGGT